MTRELLFFTSASCTACQMIKPYVEQLAETDSRIQLRTVWIENDPHTAYTYSVRSLPTLIVLDLKGRVLDTRTGSMSQPQLANWLSTV